MKKGLNENMINQIQTIQPLGTVLGSQNTQAADVSINAPNFLDVFKSIVGGAADTHAQKSQDMLDLMLGNVDDLERISANQTKAQVALELLVNTRNVTLEAYNEIIKMSI
ncbi:MAG: flagellar hook-basal body complex protein FliE [Oscillospiraceae bacterium]|nr:flagellar hook-basal body complex protein FliE [Oscillospiraceae bacterium]